MPDLEKTWCERLQYVRHKLDLARIGLNGLPETEDAVETLDDLISDVDEAIERLANRPKEF